MFTCSDCKLNSGEMSQESPDAACAGIYVSVPDSAGRVAAEETLTVIECLLCGAY